MTGVAAISLDGPKGVGKTTTALQRAATVFELDDPAVVELLRADPGLLTNARPPVLVDEWQLHPPVWDLVRRAVDAGSAPGTFLLTGSASPARPPTHSGAGRFVPVRLRPLSLTERAIEPPAVSLADLLSGARPQIRASTEVGLDTYVDEVLSSGLPGIREQDERTRGRLLDGYLGHVIDRDFEDAGHRVRNPAALRRWMTAYAAAVSTTASYEKIRDAATSGEGNKPAKTTVQPYRDTLQRMWLLEPLAGWRPVGGRLRRLTDSPKHHLADPALAARLMAVTRETLLTARQPEPSVPRDGTLLGALFESLVTLSVRVAAQAAQARVQHLRTRAGEHEVDLIVERADGAIVAFETKLSREVDEADVRHLKWLRNELGDRLLDSAVITTGTDAYRRRDGVAVIPAVLLGP
ncbi:MAG: DUF4143 domain-containing protein [Actinomycetota bacterium]